MNKFNLDQKVYIIHPQEPSEIIPAKIYGVKRYGDSFEYDVILKSGTSCEVMENTIGESEEGIRSKVDNYIKERLENSIDCLTHSIRVHKLHIEDEGERLVKYKAKLEAINKPCKRN